MRHTVIERRVLTNLKLRAPAGGTADSGRAMLTAKGVGSLGDGVLTPGGQKSDQSFLPEFARVAGMVPAISWAKFHALTQDAAGRRRRSAHGGSGGRSGIVSRPLVAAGWFRSLAAFPLSWRALC